MVNYVNMLLLNIRASEKLKICTLIAVLFNNHTDILKKTKETIHENLSVSQVMEDGAFNLSSASEVARDRTQVYNTLRNISRPKSRNTGHPKSTDYHKLQMLLSQGDYIKSVEYVSSNNNKIKQRVFVTTDSLMKWTGQFCSSSRKSSQLGIDMTYKCGPFYVTAGSFPHPSFV